MCIFCSPDDTPLGDGRSDAEVLAIERCPNLAKRVPVSIVTGFLGAGKTTLVNWLLRGSHGRKFCVLQNEFGAVPIDDALIVRSERFADVAVMTMPTGCVCCKVRGDLVEGLAALARGVLPDTGHFDAVIVETSGLSEAGPVAQTFFADRFVQRNFRLDAVIAVVDALAAPAALRLVLDAGAADGDDEHTDEAVSSDDESEDEDERAVADANAAKGARAEPDDARLRARAAKLLCEQLCLADVVLLNKIDLVSEAEATEAKRLVEAVNSTARVVPCQHSQAALDQVMDLGSFSLERALGVNELFLADSDAEPIGPAPAAPGSAAFAFARRVSRPGAVGAPRAADGDDDPNHLHAQFASVGLEAAGELDELTFSDWLEEVLRKHASRLYRAKGLLFFEGIDEPTAVHCVGAHVESERMGDVAANVGARRQSRLVFIGRTRGIEHELEEGWRRCCVAPNFLSCSAVAHEN